MNADDQAQIVTFTLGADQFAADVRAVERVLRLQSPRAVPNVPAWVAGVIDYSGRVVPVIDMRARFGLPAREPTGVERVLVFDAGGQWIAAVVDAVLDVTLLREGELEPPPPFFRGLAGEYLRGLVRRRDRLTVVLDAERLLTATETIELQAALDDATSDLAVGASAGG